MTIILEGLGLTKIYRSQQEENRVLDAVTIKVKKGEFLAIMGPSGCGKSSLLFALSTIDSLDQGRVLFDGTDLSGLSDDALSDLRRQSFGFVFQQATMLKNLSLLDNILFPAWADRSEDRAGLLDRARELMNLAGLSGLEDREVTQVSGGQIQRAGICRAILHQPAILFADEPTGALNSKISQDVLTLFKAIHEQGTTIVLVTHDAKVAAEAERVLFMKDGRVASEMVQEDNQPDTRLARLRERMLALGI